MTVLDDRTEMADTNEQALDEMFEALATEPFLEGYKIEVVGGAVHMSPQRDTPWEIIRYIVRALEDRHGMRVKVKSDVRIDFPGYRNGFAPDVAKLSDTARQNEKGRWHYADVEFIAEVISKDTAANDYGPKKDAYAAAGVPVYLIVDPYQRRCYLHTQPKDGEYLTRTKPRFGTDVDMTSTPVDLTLDTSDFPRD